MNLFFVCFSLDLLFDTPEALIIIPESETGQDSVKKLSIVKTMV